jgi:hypothetical protein
VDDLARAKKCQVFHEFATCSRAWYWDLTTFFVSMAHFPFGLAPAAAWTDTRCAGRLGREIDGNMLRRYSRRARGIGGT